MRLVPGPNAPRLPTGQSLQATEEENETRYEYSDANMRIQSRVGYVKALSREIGQLKGEG